MTFSVLQPEDLEQILSSSGNRYPIEVEIGCGNGHFLTEYGSRNRNHVFIGIDLKKSRCTTYILSAEKQRRSSGNCRNRVSPPFTSTFRTPGPKTDIGGDASSECPIFIPSTRD